MRGRVGGLLFVVGILTVLPRAWADEIVLKNGDRISGTVVKAADGKLTLDAPYAKGIEIDLAAVEEIRTETPVEVRTRGGELLKGRLDVVGGQGLVVDSSEGRGPAPLRWESVDAINPPPVKPVGWDGNLSLGGSRQTGNTERESASVGLEARRKTVKDRFTLRFLYNIATEESSLTERSVFGALKYDYLMTTSFYWYLSVEMLSDEFRDLNLRTVVGPGVGYRFWDEETREFSMEAGVAYFSEDFKEAEDNQFATGRVALDLRYLLFYGVEFVDHFVIYPDLENFGDYQLRNEASLAKKLGGNWSLKLSNILEYDSAPPEDVESTDLAWLAGIQYDF